MRGFMEMRVMSETTRCGSVAQVLHWTTALLVVVLLGMGKMDLLAADHPASAGFMSHGSLGVLVLALVAARLLWRLVSPALDLPATMTRIGRITARVMHVCLYVLLIALPLSGWLAASSGVARISLFDVATLPRWERCEPAQARPAAAARVRAAPEGNADEGEDFSQELHRLPGDALLVLVSLHFLAVLKHQFVDQDGLIWRMLPAGRLKSAGSGDGGG